MYRMKIIALIGWSGSGKDTVGGILQKQHYIPIAFAKPLKDLASELFGFPREWADLQEGKRRLWRVGHQEKTIRQILLDIGRQDRERFGPDVYVKQILQYIQTLPMDSNIVITDLRYPYELTALKEYSEKKSCTLEVWRIQRNGQNASPVEDVSEHYFDDYITDVIIQNNGISLEDLEKEILWQIRKEF